MKNEKPGSLELWRFLKMAFWAAGGYGAGLLGSRDVCGFSKHRNLCF